MHKFIQDIPGINNLDIEFFTTDMTDSWMVRNNEVIDFKNFPEEVKVLLLTEINKDPLIALRFFKAGITSTMAQLKQFTICRYGAYTSIPDYRPRDKKFTDCEYLVCGQHGNCPFKLEGIMCQQMKVANGILTHAELTYIKYLILGLTDKEIAARLFRSVHTIKKHRQNITRKLGVDGKVDIAVFGCDHNIRFPQNQLKTKKGGS